MKNKFFIYTSNMRNLPKGFLVFIILLLLVLIPLILSIALIAFAGSLLYMLVRTFLPAPRKEKTIKHGETIPIDENGNIIK